ncbi:MAG: hypothetical protein QM765_25660 [Myxococcales bacterium]
MLAPTTGTFFDASPSLLTPSPIVSSELPSVVTPLPSMSLPTSVIFCRRGDDSVGPVAAACIEVTRPLETGAESDALAGSTTAPSGSTGGLGKIGPDIWTSIDPDSPG